MMKHMTSQIEKQQYLIFNIQDGLFLLSSDFKVHITGKNIVMDRRFYFPFTNNNNPKTGHVKGLRQKILRTCHPKLTNNPPLL